MDIENKMINKIANLAKLEFFDDEKENIKNDLNRILTFIEKLNEIDTKNIDPLTFVSEKTNVLREDKEIKTITQKEALKNAPSKTSDFFIVPKVLKK